MASEQELFEFEPRKPIRGYPELHWAGKRPYTSTQYFPAQCKERYGEEQDGWINKLYWGDNLQVMSHLLKEFRGKIALIYIDPPFDSKADYKRQIEIRGQKAESDPTAFEEKQYGDIWINDEYLQFMYERLILIRELLTNTGCIYLHCDWHKSHHIRMLMDEIFGSENFLNEVIWQKIRVAKSQSKTFGNVHDILLLYRKNDDFLFNEQFEDQSDDYITKFNKIDPVNGKRYQLVSMLQSGQGPVRRFGNIELYPGANKHWIWSQERIDEAMKTGEIEMPEGSLPRKKQYYDPEKGKKISDIWMDIFPVNSQALESEDYPTQKPETLLNRIINASTNLGDIVFDCFMGSGTTQAVAMKLGRKFIGADINLDAIQTATKRLSKIKKELESNLETENKKYTNFEVYNVNNYDFFRNPLEAQDLLIQALEIQKYDRNSPYDGEKDGRMVKIMPVNRIASKADILSFASTLPFKVFEKRKDDNPHEPVEKFTIVCMGHEPGLKADLQKELANYKVDIEVVDILRDKSMLELKREAEADVQRKDNKLIIKKFYPMNLMQKLSLDKKTVSDWKELVDSVKVDFNYAGAEMEPSLIDIPEKNKFVKGEYDIPKDAGRIKVKITDLLSESLEVILE
jgi:site-specific DNA-methyltransferase (adenine-specific)/adenine-specific DNA-methyltransferase